MKTQRSSRRIAVASGKGGTGKTLISTSLALHWHRRGVPVGYADADVEAPNGHLFLAPEIASEERFAVTVPVLDGICTGCADCQRACAFNAILAVRDRVAVFHALCHGCGACILACRRGVLRAGSREVGTIRRGTGAGLPFRDGRLDIGEVRATRLIEGVVEGPEPALLVVDAPPGTSCPAVAAVRGSDLAVLVTEPTPFGLHDVLLAAGMCRKLSIRPVAVLNRDGLGEGFASRLAAEGLPVIARIPYDPRIAEATAHGRLALDAVPGFADAIAALAGSIGQELQAERT